jgi:hypothetical protein
MSIQVTVRRHDGTITTVSTGAFGSYCPPEGGYVQLTVDIGGVNVTAYYKVGWVAFRSDPFAGPVVTIGAALPSDPPPPPPT